MARKSKVGVVETEETTTPECVEAPVGLTQDEVNFYALFMAIFDSIRMLVEDDKDITDGNVKALKTEFMEFYAKLKAAGKKVRPGEQHVRLGEDALGNEWIMDDNLFGDSVKESDFVLSFFLVWMTKRCCFMAENALVEKAGQRVQTLEKKLRSLEFENKGLKCGIGRLKAALYEADVAIGELKGSLKMARGSSRLQSKRSRRLPVNPKKR